MLESLNFHTHQWRHPHICVQVFLKYEDGDPVVDQTILQKSKFPSSVLVNVPIEMRFRIKDVSRKHINRKFKLCFRAARCEANTTAILVLSKDNKKRSRPMLQRQIISSDSLEWIACVRDLIRSMCWQPIGHETHQDQNMLVRFVEPPLPIYRCVSCDALSSATFRSPPEECHRDSCPLLALMRQAPGAQHKDKLCAPPFSFVHGDGGVKHEGGCGPDGGAGGGAAWEG